MLDPCPIKKTSNIPWLLQGASLAPHLRSEKSLLDLVTMVLACAGYLKTIPGSVLKLGPK